MKDEVQPSMLNKTLIREGVRTTVCENRFEIVAQPGVDVWEQQSVQMLREWIRSRKLQEELRQAGSLSG